MDLYRQYRNVALAERLCDRWNNGAPYCRYNVGPLSGGLIRTLSGEPGKSSHFKHKDKEVSVSSDGQPQQKAPSLEAIEVYLKTMTESMTDVKKELRTLRREQNELCQKVTSDYAMQRTMARDIDQLAAIVRDGNEQPSLLHRVTLLESAVKTHSGDINTLQEHYNAGLTAKTLSKGQVVVGAVALITTTLTSVLGLLWKLLFD